MAGERGYDGAKLVTGRKRHLLVDVLGLLWAVYVHPANISERAGAKLLLRRAKAQGFSWLQLVGTDGGYSGLPLAAWVIVVTGWLLTIVERTAGMVGCQFLPRHWVSLKEWRRGASERTKRARLSAHTKVLNFAIAMTYLKKG